MRLGDSEQKQPRWDKDFIEKQLKPLKGEVSRVFVCGAPSMNETFDQAFEKLHEELGLKPKDIEVL